MWRRRRGGVVGEQRIWTIADEHHTLGSACVVGEGAWSVVHTNIRQRGSGNAQLHRLRNAKEERSRSHIIPSKFKWACQEGACLLLPVRTSRGWAAGGGKLNDSK